MTKKHLRTALTVTLALGLTGGFAQDRSTVTITLVAFNDFHGNLLPTGFRVPDPADRTKTLNIQAGGVETLGTLIRNVKKENPNTIVVGGGDLIGASPLLSGLLRDEPTIDAMNKLGMRVSVIGNHEFDYGLKELQRMQNGGCDSNDMEKACKYSANFRGAQFKYIAANVLDEKTNLPVFPAFHVETIGGVKVGFVGAVLKETPSIVTPNGTRGLKFVDEAESINRAIPVLKAQGVEAIVALVHQGGTARDNFDVVDCKSLEGTIVDIVRKLDKSIDAVITGHTHRGYQCLVDGRLVTQGDAYGHLLTRLDLTINRKSGDVVGVKSSNLVVDPAKLPADPIMKNVVARAKALTDKVATQTIAKLAVEQVTRKDNAAGESALGDLIADAQLHATKAPEKGGAVIAFMNTGGIRADLPANVPNPEKKVTYADTFAVQPFGNTLVVMTLTGAQIKTLLESQWQPTRTRILQVSEGFQYGYDDSKPVGQRVQWIKLNGQDLDMNANYRVSVNNFMADGGDGYIVLTQGKDRLGGEVDIDALNDYLKAMDAAGKPVNYSEPAKRVNKLN